MPRKNQVSDTTEISASKPNINKSSSNSMGAIISALREFKNGDFSARLPEDTDSCDKRIVSLINDIFEQEEQSATKIKDLRSAICVKGKSAERIYSSGKGQWKESVECINDIIDSNIRLLTDASKAIESAGKGDFTSKIELVSSQ